LRGNHDLGVTDALPSVCASLTKAMVHCICTCDTQLWHFVFVTIFNYQLVDGELSSSFVTLWITLRKILL